MAKRGFSIIGIDSVRKKLKKNATMQDVKEIVKANTSEMLDKQVRYSAVDTGYMRRANGMGIGDGGLTGRSYNTADYAPYVDKGTRFMAAQPFISPAHKMQKEQFKRDLDRVMK